MSSFYAVPKSCWLSHEDLESRPGQPDAPEADRTDDRPLGAQLQNGGAAAVATCGGAADGGGARRIGGGIDGVARSEGLDGGMRGDHGGPSAASAPSTAGASLSFYGRSVRRAALQGVDASELNSATSVAFRLKKSLLQAEGAEAVLDVVSRALPEFDLFHVVLASHRLARHGRAADRRAVLGHRAWPRLRARLPEAVRAGAPRQVASVAWALANLRARDAELADLISERCLRRELSGDGAWDAMSLSLVLQSFATMAVRDTALADSIAGQVRRELSASWPPADISRVAWACARLSHRDDAFFRDASCKTMARLSEATPLVLTQSIWAFATAAPAAVTSHFFPKAAEAMMEGDALLDHSAAHLAMAVWSFASVLFRPVPLLEAIGDVVPSKEERMNSQDITMLAWSYATLLAPQRRIFSFLAEAATRSVRTFNAQDLANTAWAFATAGEHAPGMLDAIAGEVVGRSGDLNCQHVAMLLWAFTTMRHRHDGLFSVIGDIARVDQSSWHSSKLFAYALAGLPKMSAELGSRAATRRVVGQLVDALRERIRVGAGEADDAHTVHDAALPWLDGEALDGWAEVDALVAEARARLLAALRAAPFEAVVSIAWWVYEEPVVRAYQCALQALGLRGLGSAHTWRLLRDLGAGRGAAELAALAVAAREAAGARARGAEGQGQDAGRGERANWCFWRGRVEVQGLDGAVAVLEEPGRLQSSTVVGYREDNGGLVAVKLSHDHVSHRAWDCEFRAMARIAAASRALLAGLPREGAEALLATGAAAAERPGAPGLPPEAAGRLALEAERVKGRLEIYMTEVPCLSCVGAMAQFRRRFPKCELLLAWDGMPADDVD